MSDLQELGQKLGYFFHDEKLLNHALRHRSAGFASNERLEFLGDATLNFAIAHLLYQRYPEMEEGELSRLRANLVNGKMLADLALGINLGQYLQLGAGEQRSGGRQRRSILADAMEAVIGAIYLDGGFDAAFACIKVWYEPKFVTIMSQEQKDAKSALQELAQEHKLGLPHYKIASLEGLAHAQTFHIVCTVSGLDFSTEGIGKSRREAEQQAAEKFLLLAKEKLRK